MTSVAHAPLAHAGLTELSADYPARVARCGAYVIVDALNLNPEEHRDPIDHIEAALAAVPTDSSVRFIGRVRNSRPPPRTSRERLDRAMELLGDRLDFVAVSLEGARFREVAFRAYLSAAALIRPRNNNIIIRGSLPELYRALPSPLAEDDESMLRSFFGLA